MVIRKLFLMCVLMCFSVLLTGCGHTQKVIPTPKYLVKKDIFLNVSEIIVKKPKSGKIATEIVRMLEVEPFEHIEQWIETKFNVVGNGNIQEIAVFELPKLELIEKNYSTYSGTLKLELKFMDGKNLKRKVKVIVNGDKGFNRHATFSERKILLYDLLQELMASAHDSIVFELHGSKK